MLFLRQNFIHKISYTPISKNPAKIRMLASHRKSQNTATPAADTARKHVHTVSRSDNPPPALKQNREGRKADTMHRAPIHTAEKAEKLIPRPGTRPA